MNRLLTIAPASEFESATMCSRRLPFFILPVRSTGEVTKHTIYK